jgi:hypothetical protein
VKWEDEAAIMAAARLFVAVVSRISIIDLMPTRTSAPAGRSLLPRYRASANAMNNALEKSMNASTDPALPIGRLTSAGVAGVVVRLALSKAKGSRNDHRRNS